MNWIIEHIEVVLWVSGLLTCSMLLMAVAPRRAMLMTFGEVAEGPVANLIARSWGAMIFASGLMLIYAAGHPEVRLPILLYSIVGKLGFIVLMLMQRGFWRTGMIAVVGDGVIVALLSWYLLAA